MTLGLALMAVVGQAQAQFGATGGSDLPLLFVFGPWVVLLVVLPLVLWLRPVWRPRLCKAIRRGVFAYLFVEFVPILVMLLVVVISGTGKEAGLMAWAFTMMGVIFSGLVLLVLMLAALALDWAFSCRRKAQA